MTTEDPQPVPVAKVIDYRSLRTDDTSVRAFTVFGIADGDGGKVRVTVYSDSAEAVHDAALSAGVRPLFVLDDHEVWREMPALDAVRQAPDPVRRAALLAVIVGVWCMIVLIGAGLMMRWPRVELEVWIELIAVLLLPAMSYFHGAMRMSRGRRSGASQAVITSGIQFVLILVLLISGKAEAMACVGFPTALGAGVVYFCATGALRYLPGA